jgi:catechol 2,3-dioxygenase-like lactoylglutathione lyase family enzyme
MSILKLHHVQLAMPRGREEEARAFYVSVLGLTEKPKPAELASRGGAWFHSGSAEIHLGVDENFTPARKAHPAFVVKDLKAILARCAEAGHPSTEGKPLAGFDRADVYDPFGNRIELLQRKGSGAEAAAFVRQ